MFVTRLGRDLQDDSCPPEINSLGRTLVRWKDQIVAWHRGHVTNGPTEAVNNLIQERSGSGSADSATTGSGRCSTPGNPTGTCSPPSHPAETRSATYVAPIGTGDAPGFGNCHPMGLSIDEAHRVSSRDTAFLEDAEEIPVEPGLLCLDRHLLALVSSSDLVAGQAGLGHLNDGRPEFEDVSEVDVGLDEAGDGEILGERTGRRAY